MTKSTTVWIVFFLLFTIAFISFLTIKGSPVTSTTNDLNKAPKLNDTSPTTLSVNAEYPVPVIQLQQLLANHVADETNTSVLDNTADEHSTNNKASDQTDKILALRNRLNQLKTLNNQQIIK